MKIFISIFLVCTAFSAHAGIFDFVSAKDKEKVTPKIISDFAEYKWEVKAGEPEHCAPYFGISADYTNAGSDTGSEFRFGKANSSGSINGSKGNLMPININQYGKLAKKKLKVQPGGDITFEAKVDTKMKDGVAIIEYKAKTVFGKDLAKVAGKSSEDISYKVKLDTLKNELVYSDTALKSRGTDVEHKCRYVKSTGYSTTGIVNTDRSDDVEKGIPVDVILYDTPVPVGSIRD